MQDNIQLLSWLYARVKLSPFDNYWNWILLEDFTYYVGYKWSSEQITIPKGFIFNGMSIPRIFWWFANPMETDGIIASLIHDWLYEQQIYTLQQTDEIFHEVLIVCGMSMSKAGILFLWLKCGSWYTWNLIRKSKGL